MQGAVQNSNIRRNLGLMIAAFAAVYLIWGSTYLGIKIAIETLPPFMMAGVRFLMAGAILMIWARLSGDYEKPKATHWRTSAIVGGFLLLGGNGAVVFAEHYISSSLTALLVATEPFWVVLLIWLWLKGPKPSLKVVSGLAIGFLGVWLLISGRSVTAATAGDGGNEWFGIVAVMIGAVSWAAGSVYGLKAPAPRSAIQTAGMQMLAGGAMLLITSIVLGDWRSVDLAAISARSIYALIYLILFGAVLGFTAYSWLLKNANPPIVATYAYVNPVIAVILGWLILGEGFTGQMLLGAGVVVGSVALITSQGKEDSGIVEEDDDLETPSGAADGRRTASATA